jgi:hypothetical protein
MQPIATVGTYPVSVGSLIALLVLILVIVFLKVGLLIGGLARLT